MSNLLEEVSVVLEADSVVVVNIPAGLIVHSDGRTEEPNLCDWILEHYPDTADVGEPVKREKQDDIPRPGIVHRLDRDTSGALIIARTQAAFEHIKQQFKDREVKKRYDVFVHGQVADQEFTIDKPIGRSKGDDFRRWAVAPYTRGSTRKACTDFVTQKTTDKASHLQAYPQTGRTHQIRVHLQSIHHPVVCDSLYSPGKPCLWGLDRQALHARRITFSLPGGKTLSAEVELPEDLQRAKDTIYS